MVYCGYVEPYYLQYKCIMGRLTTEELKFNMNLANEASSTLKI